MSHIIDDSIPSRPAGRPMEGAEKRSQFIRFRLEPYMERRLSATCRYLGISKSAAIRHGIQLFLKEAERIMYKEDCP